MLLQEHVKQFLNTNVNSKEIVSKSTFFLRGKNVKILFYMFMDKNILFLNFNLLEILSEFIFFNSGHIDYDATVLTDNQATLQYWTV